MFGSISVELNGNESVAVGGVRHLQQPFLTHKQPLALSTHRHHQHHTLHRRTRTRVQHAQCISRRAAGVVVVVVVVVVMWVVEVNLVEVSH